MFFRRSQTPQINSKSKQPEHGLMSSETTLFLPLLNCPCILPLLGRVCLAASRAQHSRPCRGMKWFQSPAQLLRKNEGSFTVSLALFLPRRKPCLCTGASTARPLVHLRRTFSPAVCTCLLSVQQLTPMAKCEALQAGDMQPGDLRFLSFSHQILWRKRLGSNSFMSCLVFQLCS